MKRPTGWFEVRLQSGNFSGQRGIGLSFEDEKFGWRMMIWIPQFSSLDNCGKAMNEVGQQKNWFYIRDINDVTIYEQSDWDRMEAMKKIWRIK